jgi:hypothetical protein
MTPMPIRWIRLATLAATAALVVACAAPPTSRAPATLAVSAPASASATRGADVVVDPTACDRALRADATAARNIRSSIDLQGNLPANDAAIASAASDPTADTATIGIPLRPGELQTVLGMGMFMDAATPMAFWVNVGRPDLFGGMWVDPPGTDRHVVSIVDDAPATRALAACLERDGLDVRYVVADVSGAELRAVQDRITAEWQDLQASGIRIVSSGVDTIAHRVVIEVEGVTQAQTARLLARYGPFVEVDALPIPEPRRPLTLPEVPLAVATDALFSDRGQEVAIVEGGWTLTGGVLDGRDLVLTLEIEPPVAAGATPGPAVLFAGMAVFGGAGDTGFQESIDDLVTLALPACDPADCRFATTLTLPADVIIPAVRRLEARDFDVLWVNVELTLVRTFDDGATFQVIGFGFHDAPVHQRAGTVGAVTGVDGPLWSTEPFPAADATRVRPGEGLFTTSFDYAAAVERARRDLEAATP